MEGGKQLAVVVHWQRLDDEHRPSAAQSWAVLAHALSSVLAHDVPAGTLAAQDIIQPLPDCSILQGFSIIGSHASPPQVHLLYRIDRPTAMGQGLPFIVNFFTVADLCSILLHLLSLQSLQSLVVHTATENKLAQLD
jgi:hypothetical protein